jgi:hypothetical protein
MVGLGNKLSACPYYASRSPNLSQVLNSESVSKTCVQAKRAARAGCVRAVRIRAPNFITNL